MLYPFFSKPLQSPSVPQPLPDFASLDVSARKAEFFAYLQPIVAAVSSDVDEERVFVLETRARVAAGKGLTGAQRARVTALVDRYDVDAEGDAPIETVLSQLAERVDTIPTSLVLVQAATESGWGTSRFAVEGNNLFGQRCYDTGCGLAPAGRTNPSFSVKAFASVEDSVRSYVHNINTHSQYSRVPPRAQRATRTRRAFGQHRARRNARTVFRAPFRVRARHQGADRANGPRAA